MLTIPDTIDHARRNFPEREALSCGDVRLTYASFYDRCRRLVGLMQDIGMQPGDRIAVLASNCHRFVEAFAALPSGGFVIVPLNYRLAEAELVAIIGDSGARMVITDRDPGGLQGAVDRVLRWPAEFEVALAAATPAVLGVGVQPLDLAALFYTFVKREPLIRAMVTGTKPVRAYEDEPDKQALAFPAGVRALACLAAAAALGLGPVYWFAGRL